MAEMLPAVMMNLVEGGSRADVREIFLEKRKGGEEKI